MADSASSIIAIADLKVELDIGASETGHDQMITEMLNQAVALCERILGYKIIDAPVKIKTHRPLSKDDVMSIFTLEKLKSITQVQYWTSSAALRDEPDGTIAGADLGRLTSNEPFFSGACSEARATHWVYPPITGWPNVLLNSAFEITALAGIDLTGANMGIKRAIILTVRHFYDGYAEVRPNSAIYQFLKPYILYRP